jgi:hypothetical protein
MSLTSDIIFEDERNLRRPSPRLNSARTIDTSAWDGGHYSLRFLPDNWAEIAKKR